jgi:hypothetical protein
MTTQYTKMKGKRRRNCCCCSCKEREREREREDTTGDLGLCWAVGVKIWRLARKRDPSFLAHVVFFGLVLEKWI